MRPLFVFPSWGAVNVFFGMLAREEKKGRMVVCTQKKTMKITQGKRTNKQIIRDERAKESPERASKRAGESEIRDEWKTEKTNLEKCFKTPKLVQQRA